MYACVVAHRGALETLETLAAEFSPWMERCEEQTILLPAGGLERIWGPPETLAAVMEQRATALGLTVSIALAGHPDTALLAARNIDGITVIPPGREVEILGPLPVEVLPGPRDLIETLGRWGVETLAGFAELPPLGVLERLGEEGGRLQALVEGRGGRPLRLARPPEEYTVRVPFEEAVDRVDPLLFAVSGGVHDLMRRMAANGQAVGAFHGEFRPGHEVRILFPIPARDPRQVIKQVQLDLEARRPRRAVEELAITLEPAAPRTAQQGLFTTPAPEPGRLQTLLARLRAIAGEDSVGAPERLNTHRPDAWRLRQDVLLCPAADPQAGEAAGAVRLSFRCFRPVLGARVAEEAGQRPVRVEARGVRGRVVAAAGPWRTAGEWWAATAWARDEWDVELDDGALYRLYREHSGGNWFVEGVYD